MASYKQAMKFGHQWFGKRRIYNFFLHGHWPFTGNQGKGGYHLYSSLPLPPANEHTDMYLQPYMWDDD